MTTIAELFVNLGIKGSEKTVGALTQVKSGLGEVKTMSLEAKAAILGAAYALESMFARAGQRGLSLTNFAATMGQGMAQTLQQYQYIGRQFGVTNEEMASSFQNIQTMMSNIMIKGQVPEWFNRVAQVAGIHREDLPRMAEHPEEFIQAMQRYAALETDPMLRNQAMKSLGMSTNMNASLVQQRFTPQALNSAEIENDKTLQANTRSQAALDRLKSHVGVSIDKFFGAHGEDIVDKITPLVAKIGEIAEAFDRVAIHFDIFQKIGVIFDGWKIALNGLVTLIDAFIDPKKMLELEKNLDEFSKVVDFIVGSVISNSVGEGQKVLKKAADDPKEDSFLSKLIHTLYPKTRPISGNPNPAPAHKKLAPPPSPTLPKAISPSPSIKPAATGNTHAQNIKVDQTLNFGGEVQPRQVADASKKAVKDAWLNIGARSRIS